MRISRLLLVVSLVLSSLALVQPAHAELSIAVVDVEYVMNEAKAAKKLQKKRADAREKFLKELSKKEQNLGEEGKAIFEKRGELSEEEFAKQRKEYEEKLLEGRRMAQSKKQAFERASNESLRALQDALTVAVQEISKKNGYTLVLSSRNVITGENSLDITKETLKTLNDNLSEIPFEIKE